MGGKLIKGVNDLETWCKQNSREELLAQWHPTKNGDLTPTEVSIGSNRDIWWLYSYDVPFDYVIEKLRGKHFDLEWKAKIPNRVRGAGCPYFDSKGGIRRVCTGFNDLATTHPEIAAQWNYLRNGELKPSEITAGNNQKVWWVCDKGHEYQAQVCRRKAGDGCPFCAGNKVLKDFNDLASTNAKLLAEWDYEKNIISPDQIAVGSHTKIWWKCNKGHSWQATVHNRTAKEATNCPYCSGRKTLIGFNDFLTYCKQNGKEYLLDEWDYDSNDISPQDITAKSGKEINWVCSYGHKWTASIETRTYGHGCPKCRLVGTSFPEQAVYFYIHKYFSDAINGDREQLDGRELDIYIPSIKTAIEYDGAEWHKDKQINDEEKNKLCAEKKIHLIRIEENDELMPDSNESITFYCHHCGNNDELSDVIKDILLKFKVVNPDVDVNRDNVAILNLYKYEFKKDSLAELYPKIAMEWNYELNEKIKPEMVAPKSSVKVWWTCSKGHNYKQAISHRTEGKGCPYCAGQKVLTGFNDVGTVYPEFLKEWDYEENTELPQNVTSGSGKKIHWICAKGHKWVDGVGHRASMKTGCPYCSNKRVLKGYNDLATINPLLLEEWDYEANKKLTPDMVTAGCNKRAWWKCKEGHHWEAIINSRSQGKGCPYCAHIIPVKVQCVETNEIFDSMGEATRKTNASLAGIHKCIKTGTGISGGYHWKSVD